MRGSNPPPASTRSKRRSSPKCNRVGPSCAGRWRRRVRVISGRVWYRGRLDPLSVGIDEDGKIAAVRKTLRADESIDHGDALILPGAVDLHVHMREPGLTHKEDFASGTRSAAIGGVTTIAEMPNTVPPVTTADALDGKASALKARGAVDYALYAAPRSGEAVVRLRKATAFKAYMAPSTGDLQVRPPELESILRESETNRKLVADHAEARPKEAETSALALLAQVRGNARIHVAHVTSREGLDSLPSGASCEASPLHLFLDTSRTLGTQGKVNPPLRSPADREALWDAFRNGRIDAVASDHAPHTLEEKEAAFDEAPAGAPGVATSFPLLIRRYRAGDLDLGRVVAAMASRPAEILGVPKGAIEVGRDADLIAVDPRRVDTIRAKRLRYKCGWTPFEGMEGCFPTAVYLRGEAVVEDGEPAAEGRGRLLAPST